MLHDACWVYADMKEGLLGPLCEFGLETILNSRLGYREKDLREGYIYRESILLLRRDPGVCQQPPLE